MSCLENIIGIKANCDGADTDSLSGYFLTDYPGLTLQAAAMYNDEKTITGYNYLVDLRRRAMLRLNNDLQAYITANYRTNLIKSHTWRTAEFRTTTLPAGNPAQRRGCVIYKKRPECRLTKLTGIAIRIKAAANVTTTLQIADTAGMVYTKSVTLRANIVEQFFVNKIFQGDEVQVTLPSDVPVYSAEPNCGCDKKKTDCARTNGVDNGVANTSEAYGIQVDIACQCDLSTLVCDLASVGLIGQAAYELCGAMFYDEMVKNHRLNYLTIYKGDEVKDQAAAGFAAYQQYMENAMRGLRSHLVNSDGGCKCVDCSGLQIKTSV